jgi:hypothetical protein
MDGVDATQGLLGANDDTKRVMLTTFDVDEFFASDATVKTHAAHILAKTACEIDPELRM